MADKVATAVAILLFLAGIIAWDQITGLVPGSVPGAVTALVVLLVAMGSLLAYSNLDPRR
jgi:hypothetical protein